MGPGALHQFTTGSRVRGKEKRGERVLRYLRDGAGVSLTALALSDGLHVPLRTMQRTLTGLVDNGAVTRSIRTTADGVVAFYRAVTP